MLIAGDIGGTNTRLALVSPQAGPRQLLAEKIYPSGQYAGLAPIVRQFMTDTGTQAIAACFDVAGPVIAGKAHLTNLPWTLSETDLARELGLRRVSLMNDLHAIAHAVPHLAADETQVINRGSTQPRAPMAILAPGTGLGEAFLIWGGTDYIACASEGGHADFAPVNQEQLDLLAFMRARFGHVAYERVCAGSGLPNIYDFLRACTPSAELPDFAAELARAQDRTPAILRAGTAGTGDNRLAVDAVRIMVEIWGAEAGNLALKVMATGGVYLAGGMPPRVLPQLRPGGTNKDASGDTVGGFMRAFTDKGRFETLLRDVPVHVVTINAALLGAAIHGLAQLDPS
ncbi:glucokinase [Rhodopila sp.]|jgi:glucokinase|uniref:glucokinase n=1 Tax=Rhodopila sp. TaxID=2480087 RepID=UPI002C77FDB3|nr:glucokinase [Rhodopila sp.]HVZ09983.1 glucokinase [Rhodopila sp.]